MENLPALSAVVVIPDAFKTVQRTVNALAAQTAAAAMEIVYVVPHAAIDLPADAGGRFHSALVVVTPFHSIGDAWAAGIQRAHAPFVVLTEDHSFPAPNWAERLIAAYAGGHAMVSPAIRNGNPNTFVSQADFFIAYGKWADPIASQVMPYLPGHNSSYRRAALGPYQAHLAEWLEQETLLHWDLVAEGSTLWLEGSTYTLHLSFSRWRRWFRAQLFSGRQFASQRAARWSRAKRALVVLASPLIPFVRFVRVRRDVARAHFPLAVRWRLYATILVGLGLDAVGQALGYGWGMQRDEEASIEQEFHRMS